MKFCIIIYSKTKDCIQLKKLNTQIENIYFNCVHKHIQPCTKYLQCEGLGYNYAPSNTCQGTYQYPLQCHDKTKILERFNTNDDKELKLFVGMRRIYLTRAEQAESLALVKYPV